MLAASFTAEPSTHSAALWIVIRSCSVVKTMCSDSYLRPRTSLDLARQAEIVILLDDGGGAAQSLFEVCSPSMIASTGCG